jgi:hypothetical protein
MTETKTPGYKASKDQPSRLARVEGQVGGVKRMVEEKLLHRRPHPDRGGQAALNKIALGLWTTTSATACAAARAPARNRYRS